MQMEKVTILVAAHKAFPQKSINGYMPVQVGAANSGQDLGFQRDDQGVNISEKNPQYCELTAQYWAWKNLQCDIAGLVHYRRYFTQDMYAENPEDGIPDADKIVQLMKEYKIIIPKAVHKLACNGTLKKNKPREQQNQPLLLLEDIIKDTAPEYLGEFEKFAYGRKVSFGNMLIAEKTVFDAYSQWMFHILSEFEKRGKQYMDEIPRLCGFLSEYLLCAWVEHNIPADKVLYMDVYNTEENKKSLAYRVRKLLVKLGLFDVVGDLGYQFYYWLKRA